VRGLYLAHMATTAISVREYLATVWRPDRDYVDGEARERKLGEKEHALIQTFLAAWFFNHRAAWQVVPLTEQRVQVNSDRFRIPDVLLMRQGQEFERIVEEPPLLCVEILSADDRMGEIRARVDDYVRMGVEDCWVIDPHARRAYVCVAGKFAEFDGDVLRVAGTGVEVPLAEMWAELG
jgi:Uma2 family endonuclease